MKNQKVFDLVATHLFTQGEQSLNINGGCVYRAKDGCKCAAGVAIKDEDYRESMEGTSIIKVVSKYNLNYLDYNVKILRSLQVVHDDPCNWVSTEAMRANLALLAYSFNLSSSVLETLSFSDR